MRSVWPSSKCTNSRMRGQGFPAPIQVLIPAFCIWPLSGITRFASWRSKYFLSRLGYLVCRSEYSRPQFLNRRGYGIRNDLNMEKGTVVDDSFINSPSGNGFYLCSHKGRIGTIKPSYYETRFNEWNIAPEQLPNDLQAPSLKIGVNTLFLARHLLVVLHASTKCQNAFTASASFLRSIVGRKSVEVP